MTDVIKSKLFLCLSALFILVQCKKDVSDSGRMIDNKSETRVQNLGQRNNGKDNNDPKQEDDSNNQVKLYKWTEVKPVDSNLIGFKKIPSSQTNIDFIPQLTQAEISQNRFLLDGTGVATADVDGDGLIDIYFTQLNGPNKLYKNLGGFQFEDITEMAGVAHSNNYSMGALFADVNGNGYQDLLISTVDDENALYINNGDGTFEFKKDSGLQRGKGSTTMTMADIEGDGDLDLFVANYKVKRVYDVFDEKELIPGNILRRVDDRQDPDKIKIEFNEPYAQYYDIIYRENKNPIVVEIGEVNTLYVNDGTGKFEDVTDERFLNHHGEAIELKPEWSLTARFQDINGDQLPDLFVVNDYYSPDRIWINQGKGFFKEIDPTAIRRFSYSSMGVAMADINRDGHTDMYVTDMLSPAYERRAYHGVSIDKRPDKIADPSYQPQYMQNSMYLNRGDSTFQEIAYFSGVEASGWSWATKFIDVDLDGYEDIIINTGYPYNAMDMDFLRNKGEYEAVNLEKAAPKLDLVNKIFRNEGDLTFTDKSEKWGFDEADVSYGMATADFDNDGDLDLVITRFRKEPLILKNMTSAPRIGVRLRGNAPNTAGIGSKIVVDGAAAFQSTDVIAGGDYLSGSDSQLMFAANPDNQSHSITVNWPNGKVTTVKNVSANRIYEIYEPEENTNNQQSIVTKRNNRISIFKDISEALDFQDKSKLYNDYERQPLLPFSLSTEGPGIAWIDYNMDGYDDLFIGSSVGNKVNLFKNQDGESFERVQLNLNNTLPNGVTTSIIGWPVEDSFNMVLGNSNYNLSKSDSSVPSVISLESEGNDIWSSSDIQVLNATTAIGPLALADYDGDGDLDLFVAGRVSPGKYPLSVSSKLLMNNGNNIFEVDSINEKIFRNIGLVTGAVFSDYDGDGDPDLFVSTEWGAIKLFENQDGQFKEITEKVGLSNFKGMWKSVVTGDFNNDGLIDIVATNMGKNSPYKINSDKPLKMFYYDLNNNGHMEIIESFYDEPMQAYVPMRKLYEYSVFESIIAGNITSYKQYAQKSLHELLGTPLDQLPSKEINTLEHMLFLNNGDTFEAHPLPAKAQFTMSLGAAVADFNNDGNEDLFLSQNYFNVPEKFPRQDAGKGMLLKGNGIGGFEVVSASESGIEIYGQQRGAAFGDFNNDGKIDLVVAQRDGNAKLYLNQIEKSGFRVKLRGTNHNVNGVGTKLRLVYDDGSYGPMREVQSGSGHYSMNSVVMVLGIKNNTAPEHIHVLWPDGIEAVVPIKPNQWNYKVLHPDILLSQLSN